MWNFQLGLLWEKVLTVKEILKNNAIYDLSKIYKGEKICVKMNKTESQVFKEFEKFLQERGIKVVSHASSNSANEISVSKKT